tara:strand:- start:3181 stop:3660 length:480 start_codon:yes stop_codon:yes gene_type:complete
MPNYTADYVADRSMALGGKLILLERTMDFAEIAAYRAGAGLTALAAGDVYESISFNAKTFVLAVGVDVTRAGTTGLTLDVGDGTDPDGYLDGVSGAAVGSFQSGSNLTLNTSTNVVVGTAYAYSLGKYYTAADTIDLTLVGQVPGNLICRLWALVADFS